MSKQIVHYVLLGEPLGFVAQGENRHMWDNNRQARYNTLVNLMNMHGALPPLKGSLKITVNFYLTIHGKSKSRKGLANTPHTGRPKINACLRFVEDVLSSTIFEENHHIVSIVSNKYWDVNPRTEITIQEL